MATSRTSSSRSLVGWFLIAAGVVYLLGLLVAHLLHASSPWWNFFAFVLLAIGFVLLFLWRVGTLLRVAFIVAAIGWALLGIDSVASLGSTIHLLAVWAALLGTLVAGIIVIVRHTFSRLADIAFLLAAIFAALFLGNQLRGFLSGSIETIIAILFAALFAVSGFLIQRKR